MKKQEGKITIISLVLAILLIYGGFCGFKYLQTSFVKKDIAKGVVDSLGKIRSGTIPLEKISEQIGTVLENNDVLFDPGDISVSRDQGVIHYSFNYDLTTDYLIFKHLQNVEVVNDIESYGY